MASFDSILSSKAINCFFAVMNAGQPSSSMQPIGAVGFPGLTFHLVFLATQDKSEPPLSPPFKIPIKRYHIWKYVWW